MSNAKASHEGTQQVACHKFSRTGSCSFGDRCKFRHIQATATEPHQQIVATAPPNFQARNLAEHPTVPCTFFVQKGTCKYGDSCKYIHDIRYAQQTTAAAAATTITVPRPLANQKASTKTLPKRPVVTDTTPICPETFSSRDKRGQPQGRCTNTSCTLRHYATNKDIAEWSLTTFGWAPIHSATFYAGYRELAKLLSESNNPNALINLRTTKAYVIEWSEHDAVDRCFDHYKITIPAGSTALDIVKTRSTDLDRDSPNRIAVVDYLADSHEGSYRRNLCLQILNDPTNAMAIVASNGR
jgi:hypothetical protein